MPPSKTAFNPLTTNQVPHSSQYLDIVTMNWCHHFTLCFYSYVVFRHNVLFMYPTWWPLSVFWKPVTLKAAPQNVNFPQICSSILYHQQGLGSIHLHYICKPITTKRTCPQTTSHPLLFCRVNQLGNHPTLFL